MTTAITMTTTTTTTIAPPALEVRGLTVTAQRDGHPVPITEDLDLTVAPGEAVAIVGESGSGKSVTAKALMRLLPMGLTVDGAVHLGGRDTTGFTERRMRRLRGTEISMVMQDPFTMLNPMETCGAQLAVTLTGPDGRRLSGARRREEVVRRLAEVGITDPAVADKYPFELSGGMRQRVGIAAAISRNPRVIIADEPTTALDVTTQKEILDLLNSLRTTHRIAVVLITHDLGVAFSLCDRVYVMYAGQIVETADASTLMDQPKHPYTASLLAADPPIDRRVEKLASIPGSVPPPGRRPAACRFAPRCEWAVDACRERPIELLQVGEDHAARCIRFAEIGDGLQALAMARRDQPHTGSLAVPAAPVITTRDARRVYGEKVAVAGATIEVRRGESVGIVGESGSGKTTLARMLVGLTLPSSGSVQVGGVELSSRLSRADRDRVRSTVQMAFQDPSSTLNPSRSVGSTLREALRLVSLEKLDERTAELLELVGLPPDYAKRMPAQLSGGERQRVAIARGLARDPDVLVCDEVVSALDVSVQAHILNLLRDLQTKLGIGYVFITHDLAVVRQITDRVYVMRRGEIVESGPTDQVLDEPRDDYTRSLLASVPSH
ncbi:ABC transporter ATP-binding protein [Microbacterium sp.]|uniref:ABC transporter ATP-binding protein n=1 Tax=Microbacterium sp. TaxID=51671 RepID=UPI002D76BE9A|nr:ABC transporter ATP-binding protein [Microbacterium sp.]HET6302198.1 ABC transporter ATP-binding protein [Microbacterium sp.]